jgi:hypothetical protein
LSLFCSGYFWKWDLTNYLPRLPQTVILLISAFKVARITDVSHRHQDIYIHFFFFRQYLTV